MMNLFPGVAPWLISGHRRLPRCLLRLPACLGSLGGLLVGCLDTCKTLFFSWLVVFLAGVCFFSRWLDMCMIVVSYLWPECFFSPSFLFLGK